MHSTDYHAVQVKHHTTHTYHSQSTEWHTQMYTHTHHTECYIKSPPHNASCTTCSFVCVHIAPVAEDQDHLGHYRSRMHSCKVVFGFSRFKLVRLLSQHIHTATTVFLVLTSLVKVVFHRLWTLCQMLVCPKDQVPVEEHKGVVYSIPCVECPGVYIGQTGRYLKHHVNEHCRAWRMGKSKHSLWHSMCSRHMQWTSANLRS